MAKTLKLIKREERFTEIPKLLTRKEVIEMLKIDPSTLYRWCIQKKLSCVKVSRKVYFDKKDILKLLNNGCNNA